MNKDEPQAVFFFFFDGGRVVGPKPPPGRCGHLFEFRCRLGPEQLLAHPLEALEAVISTAQPRWWRNVGQPRGVAS